MIFSLVTFTFLFLAPGYLIAKTLGKRDADIIIDSSVISFLLFGSVAYGLHLFGQTLNILTPVMVFAVALAAYLLRNGKRPVKIHGVWIAIILCALILRFGLFYLNPLPVVGDSYMHYSFSKSFFEDTWYTSGIIDNFWTDYTQHPFIGSYRPPGQDFLHALAMLFSEISYQGAVGASVFFGATVIWSSMVVAEDLFSTKCAKYAGMMMACNFFMISRSIELEPRLMLSFFILALLHYSNELRKNWFFVGASAGISWLIHYSAIWFIMAIIGYAYLTQTRRDDMRRPKGFKILIWIVAVSILVACPWLLRNISYFSNPLYSTARFVPFMDNWEQYHMLSPPSMSSYLQGHGSFPQNMIYAVGVRAINLLTTYAPPPQKALERGLAWTLSNSQVNLVGPVVFLFAIFGFVGLYRRQKTGILGVIIIFASLVGPLFTGYPKSDGVSIDFLSPLTPILIIFAAYHISKNAGKGLLTIAILTLVIQAVVLSTERGASPKDDALMDWVLKNTKDADILMSVQAHELNFYTQRDTIYTPLENTELTIETAKKLGVDYIIITETDRRLRDLDDQKLEDAAIESFEVRDARIYSMLG